MIRNDTLIVHGGQLLSGDLQSDLWVLDLQPALRALQAGIITCRTLQYSLGTGRACSWSSRQVQGGHVYMGGHSLGILTGAVDVMLMCGGTSPDADQFGTCHDTVRLLVPGSYPCSLCF